MSVPTIALYSTPPTPFCSSIVSSDCDLNLSSNSVQKPTIGGLSCLFSAQNDQNLNLTSKASNSLYSDDLSSSFSFKSRDSSPVSVFSPPRSPNLNRICRKDVPSINGYVRTALGSCLDYNDSMRFVENEREELDFDFDEGLVELDCEEFARDFLIGAQSRNKIFYEELVVKAFYEAEKAHRGQTRASGDPYLLHCLETAELLAKIGANATIVAAGLLHDTLDDSFMNYDYIFRMFGVGVADLVEGVSKLSQLSKLARDNNIANKTAEADRLHTMFLAMADARAVLIKLADRLHNMMTLEALPVFKQQRFAKETLEIFAPLANRLGIFTWKEQLESLCFKYLYPEEHKELASKLAKSYDEAMISSAIDKLETVLNSEGVSYHVVSGRHKSLYSIYKKMIKKNLTVDEIHDIHGLRLIVDKNEDCYRALDIVHKLWPEVLGRLKDYIVNPKFNGYQSLHTVVVGEDMLPLEVQIRTKEMHLQAEFGFAAHWRYKEGDCKHSSFLLHMVEWARWVVTWQCEAMSNNRSSPFCESDLVEPKCPFPSHLDECPYSYTRQCDHDGPMYVIMLENEKMSVQEFPPKSTVNDLLERAGRVNTGWDPYSFPVKEELRPRLNHKPVSDPNHILKMGDIVELTPAIPDKSLTEYREEIQRMYERGYALSVPAHQG